jgi:hypothetical protein
MTAFILRGEKIEISCANGADLRDTNEVQCQELTAVNFERTNWFEKVELSPLPCR